MKKFILNQLASIYLRLTVAAATIIASAFLSAGARNITISLHQSFFMLSDNYKAVIVLPEKGNKIILSGELKSYTLLNVPDKYNIELSYTISYRGQTYPAGKGYIITNPPSAPSYFIPGTIRTFTGKAGWQINNLSFYVSYNNGKYLYPCVKPGSTNVSSGSSLIVSIGACSNPGGVPNL